MELVSWGFAFRKGFVIWLWGIVWGIVGGIIAMAISGTAILGAFAAGTAEAFWAAFAVIMIGVMLGVLIASIGIEASRVKVIMEGALEAREKVATRMCPQCGRTLPLDLKFCPHCGKTLT
jgi:hypothetical protein